MHRSIVIFGIVTVLIPGVVVPDEEAGPSRDRDKKAEQARKLASGAVITNDLLERLYGPGSTGVPDDGAEAAPLPALPDPLATIDFELGRLRENRAKLSKAEERVREAEQALQKLESRKAAIANPYLPRPVLSKEESDSWEGLDNAERVRLTEQAIATARGELETARTELQRLQQGG